MIKGQINLMALTNAFTETRKNSAGADVECITIPLAVNHLEKDQYGVKLRIIGWDRPNLKGNATHIVNQDVPKEVGEALKAAGEYPPTLGNFWDNGGAAAPAQGKTDPATMPLPAADKGGLPF